MERVDTREKETEAYRKGPFDDLKVQEALTIIAIYAAQMDYQNCETDVKRIEEILEDHPLFVARKKEIFAMINKYVNEMEVGDSDKSLTIAADALKPEQKKTAFELAVDVALTDKNLTDSEEKILATMKSRLSISDEFAKQAIRNKIEIERNWS
jgi:hypothetical protein